MLSKNITESGIVQTGHGKLNNLIINSHTSGTVKVFDGTETGVVATTTLTSAGACAPANYGTSTLTSTGNSAASTHAVSVLTGDAIVTTNVMVIGTRTYTFVAELTGAADEILVGTTLTATLVNAKNAINATAGVGMLGVTYGFGTVVNTQVRAVASDATTLTVRGIVPGTSLNTVATTGTALRTVWEDTTLGGGTGASDAGITTGAATVTIGTTVYTQVDALSETYGAPAVAYQVLRGASEATYLANLKKAVNATGVAGTDYSTGTVAHPDIVGTTLTTTTLIVRTRTIGTAAQTTALNAIATTETMANTGWTGATMSGAVTTDAATFTLDTTTYTGVIVLAETLGLTAVPNQILWVTSEAVFLDNVKSTINLSGVMGTTYGTGTTAHPTVVATTNTDTTQVFNAKNTGTAGNSIATTETMANYAFTALVMGSGAGATGSVLIDTITFSVVATTGERFIDFGGLDVTRGIYVTVGGTANVTLGYDTY